MGASFAASTVPSSSSSMFPPPPGPPPAYPKANMSHITEKLQTIIYDNRLQPYYSNDRLQSVLARLSLIDYAQLARKWRINSDLVYDLCALALYDIVFYVDDSGSMAFEEKGERIDDLKFIVSQTAEMATLFDDDGVQVRFMNSDIYGEGIRTAVQVQELVQSVRFSGMTPLGTFFRSKVVDPLVVRPAQAGTLHKPVLAIVITDGEPTREPLDTLRTVIMDAKRLLGHTPMGTGSLAVQIGQVGTDVRAQEFLASLDNDPVVGGMIDCTSNYEMESAEIGAHGHELTPEMWLLKLCLGAIDRTYDDTD
ncbi:hypothetical protein BASA50_007539 [Batrachochytrium salamandrivorans]|uniref:VWFA domain-containing protein n=1 Tax=Batrachochytrium salamandrivorans TaxID=1357716 RepID=A0ABQ8F723_9FUNG|nr:hypothetical protein BASA60_004965 [Batrachochytrium salamandrivorans]KAH6593331.1 hypothetical protein BASA50_007539 [Batrachochytrium salamandrivorans]KAH9274235.1 hypothetical protein BASA83_003543 [Batrachochytrium salamandrivorans]KAJ1343127.1 hypothetical protein BSLG_002153 [Batrachochytrium salamandrivorans]